MVQEKNPPLAFSRKDQEMIVNILSNQPLQNLAAADNVRGLIVRFLDFTNSQFSAREGAKAAPVKAGRKAAEESPAS